MAFDTGIDTVVLPELFRPRAGVPLVRLGRDRDGGYLIDGRNLSNCDLLISMGIGDDWSFEDQFLKRRDIGMFAYDASVSGWELFVRIYAKIVLFEPRNAWRSLRLYLRYLGFFNRRSRIHRQEHIGNGPGVDRVAFPTVLSRDVGGKRTRLFIKMDIEGDEYDLLDNLVDCAGQIEGLIIELHDIDRNMARIRTFIEAFPLVLCHVHANNYATVLDDGLPTVIECSFTSQPVAGPGIVSLPNELDLPNCPDRPELAIRFRGADIAGLA